MSTTWGIARKTNPSGSELFFTYGTSANYASNPATMTLEPDGNVGIGTSNPNSNRGLTIQGIDAGSSSNWIQLRTAAGIDEWHMNSPLTYVRRVLHRSGPHFSETLANCNSYRL
ncbi:MAG: hypothetical protein IPK83_02605 [Planctomycetes bacterium]|nr:hypothetical protein [Planctomycetota bacterium]